MSKISLETGDRLDSLAAQLTLDGYAPEVLRNFELILVELAYLRDRLERVEHRMEWRTNERPEA